jgi:hypothetical protein
MDHHSGHLLGTILLVAIVFGGIYLVVAKPWREFNDPDRIGRRWRVANWLLLACALFILAASVFGGPADLLIGGALLCLWVARFRRRRKARA